ncbi:MAG: dTDP-4-dehydrorhamnose reductase [Thermoleophilaceae bacterium]|nr:dTDP-4-dehydrorhamnose reductase [Thermoleophilaceae bacterium]
MRQASARGWRVVGTYLHNEPSAGEAVRLDVTDAAAVAEAVERARPDRIIHTAYRQDDRSVTVDGTVNVARAAARIRARLVHVSSDVVFSGRLGRPYREGDRLDAVTEYGRAKADAERAVGELAPAAVVVRTSLLVAGSEPNRQERPALEAAAGRAPYPFFTDELRCPIAVADAAAALIEIAHLPLVGPLHVAGADAVSRYELACLIAGAAGLPADRIPAASGSAAAGRPADCRLDSSLARRVLRTRLRGAREVFAVT